MRDNGSRSAGPDETDRIVSCDRPRGHGRRGFGSALLLGLLALTAGAASAAEPALRFGVAPDVPPLAFRDRGVVRGLEIDLAQALCAELGREMRLLALAPPRLAEALRGGRIDVMLTTMPAAELRVLGLAASEPLLRFGQMALVRGDDLRHYARVVDLITTERRVGYEHGTAGARFVQQNLTQAQRVPLADAATGITALRHGRIDVFIHAATTVWTVATAPQETALAGLFRPLTQERLAWVVRHEDQPLHAAIDRVVEDWRDSGRLDRLINRWLPVLIRVEE